MKENKKYVVIIKHEGGIFYVNENDESCGYGDDYFIDDKDTAKKIYDQHNYGNIELQEYDGSDEWENYVVLEEKCVHQPS